MSTKSFRLPEGGLIDRGQPLSFRFDGATLSGYRGDSLASALLANGVRLVGRSFKYHRPRGIVAAGAEEPNALVQLGRDPRTEPNMRATQVELYDGLHAEPQHAWPSLKRDVGAVNDLLSPFFPAGFYYKTFMWPAAAWMRYEHAIRKAAGLGKSPTGPDPDRYDKTFAHCDVLVIGAGPAGLAAALAAGRTGARVILAEQDHRLGGSLLAESGEADGVAVGGKPALDWVGEAEAELEGLEQVRILRRTVVASYYDHSSLVLVERLTDHLDRSDPDSRPGAKPRQRAWKVRAKRIVLAAGAIERPLVFRNNDRPGIMLAEACRTYLRRYAVKPGERALVFTNNDGAYRSALALHEAGAEIAAVVDLRGTASGPWSERARAAGLKILTRYGVTQTGGRLGLEWAKIAPLRDGAQGVYGGGDKIECDLIAASGGWSPSVHLFSQARGKLAWDGELGCYRPKPESSAMFVAGAANGTFGLASALDEGWQAGEEAAKAAGLRKSRRKQPDLSAPDEGFGPPDEWLWIVPSGEPLGVGGKHFVDHQNDSTAADLKLALREGFRSIEHVKRYTTTGMATDQGKTSNVNAIGIVSETLEKPIPEVGVTTFRPPYTPITFGAVAGRDLDDFLDPVRITPMHAWHVDRGAVFEDVGQWKRPWYYPRPGEDMHAAVNRECLACRDGVGILDATTLGKIDIQGPDAATLLNRVYTNAWSKLEVGRCRYGLMLNEAGMVMDDGVTSRIAENRFLMTTTTGNAAQVLAHLEEWVQTEWPDLKVHMTSVTEQFATASIAGPNARRLLAELCQDVDLEDFPHMSWRAGHVAGLPARVFRISFTGELSYEINVPATYGMALWEALMRAGRKYGITPYGTETMHVLRAEKGYIIVGQETDGSVTPIDLGMDWIVSKTKDFIGKRSLSRTDMLLPDRKQLVGLLTANPGEVLPEGAQLVERASDRRPLPMLGHVTSSYWSATLDRSIALALVKGGRERIGQTLQAPLAGGRTVACTVTQPVFFDPEGSRQNV